MEVPQKRGFVLRVLDKIERNGNKLPDPVTLFVILSALIMVVSFALAKMGVSIVDPVNDGQLLEVNNLLSKEGIAWIFESAVTNFTGFAPLGTVLVVMLGIGLAERSGLIGTSLRGLVTSVPSSFVTVTVVFAGVMSSMASDAGYVILTPLGAVVFAAMGRHPLAGLAAAFAGVSGGYSANLLLTSLDPMLGEMTISAASVVDPEYAAGMSSAMNYFFMIASVFLVTIVGTFITTKVVEPRLGTYKGEFKEEVTHLTKLEKKGLWAALVAFIVSCLAMALLVIPEWGPLRGEGEIVNSPFFKSLVPVMLIVFLIPGLVYGIVTKQIKSDKDVTAKLNETMASMGSYIVLAFAAAQFVAYFNYTNLGRILAIKGAEIIENLGIGGFGLIVAFILISGFINLFIGSASAKWAIMAPVFVPIMMSLGYSPELTQVVYRIADSTTNIISPLLPYFAIIIAFAQKYDKKAGIGTLLSMMLPYSIAFTIAWVILLGAWMLIGLPLGPGAPIFYGG
ncbi:MAG: AbgT family transporter [Bacillaceae bacterium]